MFKSLKLMYIFTFCLGIIGCSADSDVPWMPIDPMPHATCEEGDICAYDGKNKFLGILLRHYYGIRNNHNKYNTEILLPEGYHLYVNQDGEEYHVSTLLSRQWPLVIDDSSKALHVWFMGTDAVPNSTATFVTVAGGGFEAPKRICYGGFPELNAKANFKELQGFKVSAKYPTVHEYNIGDLYDGGGNLKAKECPKGMLDDKVVLDLPITLKDSDGNVFEEEFPIVTSSHKN